MTVSPVVVASRYRLGETLGRGGMGRVFLARDEILDRDVAIKEIVLPAEMIAADRDAVQQRTLREARAAARISHPNAAQVYDVVAADGATWIVMEYVKSRSLQDIIAAGGRWSHAGSPRSAWPCWAPWTRRTGRGSGTATSSRPTCCWATTAGWCSPTSASRPSRATAS